MEPVRIFSTQPVNFKIYAGRPASQPVSDRSGRPVFLRKVSFHCSRHVTKNFQKGGMGEVLKFVTPDGGFRKKRKKGLRKRFRTEVSEKKRKIIFAFFAKIAQF